VRCRERVYLDRFRELYCPELGESLHFHHDYPWKAYVTREALAAAVGRMVLDIDAQKFKPLTHGPKGLHGKEEGNLHSCYSSFWSTHLRYGDGTSSFDVRTVYPAADSKWRTFDEFLNRDLSSTGDGVATVPEGGDRCSHLGHWWVDGKSACQECGQPKTCGVVPPAGIPVFSAAEVDGQHWPDDTFAPDGTEPEEAGEDPDENIELVCDDCVVELTGQDAGCQPDCPCEKDHDGLCFAADAGVPLTKCTICNATGRLTAVESYSLRCKECREHGGRLHKVTCSRRFVCQECGFGNGLHRTACSQRQQAV
jgi:hypothetical protein